MRSAFLFSITFFLILISIGAATFFESKASIKQRSLVERRRLTSLPNNPVRSLKAFQEFPSHFDAYMADNFRFRLSLISLANQASYYVFGDMPSARYFRGLKGWFFRGEDEKGASPFGDLQDMQGKANISGSQVNTWIEKIKYRNEYFKKIGAKYYFGIAPRKASVYSEFLPAAIFQSLGRTRLDQLQAEADYKLKDIWVDLKQALIRQKNTELFPRLYFMTDSHWNYVGAYYGYRIFFDRLGIGLPYLPEVFSVHLKNDWIHTGFQSETGLSIMEPFPSLFPSANTPYQNIYGLKPRRGEVREGQEDFASGAPLTFTNAGIGNLEMPGASVRLLSGESSTRCRRMKQQSVSVNNKRVILLLGDSFLEKAAPFFAAHAEYTYFCRQILDFDPPIYDSDLKIDLKPDIVIQSFIESYLLREND